MATNRLKHFYDNPQLPPDGIMEIFHTLVTHSAIVYSEFKKHDLPLAVTHLLGDCLADKMIPSAITPDRKRALRLTLCNRINDTIADWPRNTEHYENFECKDMLDAPEWLLSLMAGLIGIAVWSGTRAGSDLVADVVFKSIALPALAHKKLPDEQWYKEADKFAKTLSKQAIDLVKRRAA